MPCYTLSPQYTPTPTLTPAHGTCNPADEASLSPDDRQQESSKLAEGLLLGSKVATIPDLHPLMKIHPVKNQFTDSMHSQSKSNGTPHWKRK